MTLHEHLTRSRTRYVRKVRALRSVTKQLSARDVAAFVLLTPRQPYERAVAAWRTYRETGSTSGPGMHLRRGAYIEALPSATRLRRRRGESRAAWAERLQRTVKGLGPAKAPFLTSLLEPTGRDVPVCVDVWMLRGLGFTETRARRGDASTVRAAQNICEFMAKRYAMPRFAWQWAAWDYFRTRGIERKQQVMFVSETYIERDLGV